MKVYVINLASRPDRLDEFQAMAATSISFEVKRFNAVALMDGHQGCTMSHLTLLRKHINAYPNEFPFAVFEDDCKMLQPWTEVEKSMAQLPEGWDILYLGATLNKPLDRFSPNLFRLTDAWATHAMIYSSRKVVDFILANHNTRKVDVFYREEVQKKFNCFITYPLCATQSNIKSNITKNANDNENLIIQRYAEFAKP